MSDVSFLKAISEVSIFKYEEGDIQIDGGYMALVDQEGQLLPDSEWNKTHLLSPDSNYQPVYRAQFMAAIPVFCSGEIAKQYWAKDALASYSSPFIVELSKTINGSDGWFIPDDGTQWAHYKCADIVLKPEDSGRRPAIVNDERQRISEEDLDSYDFSQGCYVEFYFHTHLTIPIDWSIVDMKEAALDERGNWDVPWWSEWVEKLMPKFDWEQGEDYFWVPKKKPN